MRDNTTLVPSGKRRIEAVSDQLLDVPTDFRRKRQRSASPRRFFYTKEEKAWINDGFGSEWEMLKLLKLKMDDVEERERGRDAVQYAMEQEWEAITKDREARRREGFGAASAAIGPFEYTESEKKWLKTFYGGEYKFLMQHGLKIFKPEDREDGRRIARALMTDDVHYNAQRR